MYKHPLFNGIDIKKYESKFVIEKHPANTLLFHEGDECNSVGIILKGQLTISTMTSSDNEYIINILKPNDIFGDTLLFSEKTVYLGDGIISKDSTILFIAKDLLLEMFKEQKFLLNFLQSVSQKSLDIRNRLKLLSHKSISERIIFYLESESKKIKSKEIPIKSKENLAKILNIPRPSLSRELINLKKKKLIDYNRYCITLMI